jgi:hypothetical protein
MLALWSNVCMLYEHWIQWLFMAGTALMGSYYIISGMGHPMSDLIMSLVLCTIVCNIRGTGIILQVPQTALTLLRMSNISGRPYC